jgi:hypothetical protein
MKKILFIFIFAVTLFADWKTQRENLEKVYFIDDFRIFYSFKGEDAIQNQADINQNKIPDFIENLGLQFSIANEILHNSLKFKKPLENSVYKNRAQYIDIHVMKLNEGNNGLAGDRVIQYNYKNTISNGKSISMTISNKLNTDNLTPLHELFHIYQNGYTLIKNRWYTEGTARWSEMIFRKGFGITKNLPKTNEQLDYITSQTYDAQFFWNRLAYLCSSKQKFDITRYKNINYIGLNKNIIDGNEIHGFEFIRSFLANLDSIDNIISQKRGFNEFEWEEKYQKDKFNNLYIFKAILKTIEENSEICSDSDEILQFIHLLKNYK